MDPTKAQHNLPLGVQQHSATDTSQSEKVSDVRAEAESILEAVEVGSDTSSKHGNSANTDVEKDSTPATVNALPSASSPSTAQDWDGPDDPDNPQNWSLLKRIMHVFAIGFLAFAVTAGSSMITPAVQEIEERFDISQTVGILAALSVFVLGLGLGPVLAAPISETMGRSVVYKASALIYMLFLLGSGFSKSFGSLLVCRLFAGITGGPVLAVGAGTNADLFPMHQRAVANAFFIMAPFLGPALGPVIGGFAVYYKGWQWTQWCTLYIALAAYVFILPMNETYKKVILKKRAKRLGIAPPPTPPISGLAYAKLLLTITLVRPVHMLFTEPIVLLFSLYNAFTFSVLFAFFAAYPYTFESVYGFNTWEYGLTFLGIGIGVFTAVVTAIAIDRTVYISKYKRAVQEGRTMIAPEYRLYAGIAGAFGVPIGLFWFAWTARRDVHWISPVLAGIPFAWGNLCVFIAGAGYLIDVYGPLNGASAMAANGLVRYGMGSIFPLFTLPMFRTLGIGGAASLLGGISVLMLPIPWIFFKFGPRIRAKSRYDTLKI